MSQEKQIQDLQIEVAKLSKELESQHGSLNQFLSVLKNLHSAVNAGFDQVNERLSHLEGKHGMQGVNAQLAEIKQEINKIQITHGYQDLSSNLELLNPKGEA
jgi:uncharacterized coiled-coil protein SlyX